jgi:uncharacterized membrane protein YhhN
MALDLAHKRPWLLASLICGITYPLVHIFPVPGLWALVWKVAGLSFLIPYALRRHHSGEFALLAAILAFCALGDALVEWSLELGAIGFGIAHIIAIWLYSRHRRLKAAFSQQLLALALLVCTPIIAYFLAGGLAAIYTVLLGGMAAMAWSSNFPRYRVGLGAVFFVVSDLLLFAREAGAINTGILAHIAVWYSYYFGMVLITVGIIQTLIKRGHYADPVGL